MTIGYRAVFAAFSVLTVAGTPVVAQPVLPDTAAPRIMREFRGVWVATVANIDWPSRPGLSAWDQQAELIAILNRAVALNLNAVILQVRPAADALYASPLEPWSEYLTGRQGTPPEPWYDPLVFAVREAHARGLELHAWFNPYRARHPTAKGPQARTHLSETRPQLVRSYGTHLWMDPGEPAVRRRTINVMLDVVRRYDVDGIHIDDYFYPYPEIGRDSVAIPFPDSVSYARYVRGGGRLARDDWRRSNVDTLIHEMYVRTRALKPWVKVGISPFGIWRPGNPAQIQGFDAYDKLYADARRWLREGWLDYWTPQLYWPIAQTPQSYPALLQWWMGENVRHRHVWPGQFSSRAIQTTGVQWPADELMEQVKVTRSAGATGTVHFSMRALMPAPMRRDSAGGAIAPNALAAGAGLAERLKAAVYTEPALIPASTWMSRVRPAAPRVRLLADTATGSQVVRLAPGGERLVRWWTVRALIDGQWRSWVLPGGQRELSLGAATATRPSRLLVTAVDRYGNESRVVELK
jgi:uncharacterized lipoprotein YddW (UPF0748 family)